MATTAGRPKAMGKAGDGTQNNFAISLPFRFIAFHFALWFFISPYSMGLAAAQKLFGRPRGLLVAPATQ